MHNLDTYYGLIYCCREKDLDIAFAQDAIDEYKVTVVNHIFSCTLHSFSIDIVLRN